VQVNDLPPIDYSGATSLTVRGGRGSNLFKVISISSGVPVSLEGGGGRNRLVFDDSASVGWQRTSLYADRLDHVEVIAHPDGYEYVNPWSVSFAGIQAIDVFTAGGYYNDTYVYGSAPTTSVRVHGNVNSYDAFVVDVQTNAILGPVSIFGQPPSDFAYYDDPHPQDRSAHTYTFLTDPGNSEALRVERSGTAPVVFQGLIQVIAFLPSDVYIPGLAGNVVNILSSPAQTFLNMVVGNGDQVTIGSRAPDLGGTLAGLLGGLAVRSYQNDDAVTLLLDDAGNSALTPRTVTIAPPTSPSYPLSSVSGLAASRIDFLFNAVSQVGLRGGAANETFVLKPGLPDVKLSIDGGGGSNGLDYSAYTGDVVVDLPLGMATGFAGGISHIQNVTGSIGNDILVGDANANILRGGTGRNFIIAGAGADQLFGGGGDNLLIAGYTLYDRNLVALDAVMKEWTSGDSYATRVRKIGAGVAGSDSNTYALVGGKGKNRTVFDEGLVDVLTCNPNVLDRVFAGSSDQIGNPNKKDTTTGIF
jgi:hypothetical protein